MYEEFIKQILKIYIDNNPTLFLVYLRERRGTGGRPLPQERSEQGEDESAASQLSKDNFQLLNV